MKKRPYLVTIIAWIFVLAGIIGFVFHVTEVKARPRFQYDLLWPLGLSLLAILCGFYMLRQSNWARWLAVAWLAFHVILSGFHSTQGFIVHTVLLAVFAYFLFRPQATAYFRGTGTEGT
jgi:hypothetical protein